MKGRNRVKTNTVFQMEMTECGAASLSMLMKYHGVNIPLEQLRVDTGVSRDGCRASKILKGARKYGFKSTGKKVSLEVLLNMRPPCIIHWNFNHFLVYEGRKKDKIFLNDPAEGRRVVSKEEMDKSYTGVVLNIETTEDVVKTKGERNFLNLVTGMVNKESKSVFVLFLIGLLIAIPGALIPIFLQFFVDEVLLKGNAHMGALTLSILIGLIISKTGYTYLRNVLLIKFQNKLSLLSTYSFVEHLFKIPIDFFQQRYAGDLVNRVENNNRICEFIAGEITETAMNVVLSVIYVVVLFAYSPTLTIFVVGILTLNLILLKRLSSRIAVSISKIQQDSSRLLGAIYSGVSIIDSIKASGVENLYVSRILGHYSKVISGQQKHGKLQMISSCIPRITKLVSEIVIIVFGANMVIHGQMTIGVIVAFIAIFHILIEPVNQIAAFIENLQMVSVDSQRVDDIMKAPVDKKFSENQKQHFDGKLEGRIRIENLKFGYISLEEPLIDGFNFNLSCGKSIALVGSSGSGKSTVAKIISGLYTPWEGAILFDEVPYNTIPNQTVNLSISTVNQEVFIFRGSIKENITMWNKSISEEDIIQAAKDAEIHEVITKKENAYEHMLDEGGRNLSGGQRQRIEIARALVNNPSVIIMDEATSALDAITERNIVNNIKRRGCSTVVVAHRISTIRDCDEIVVMDKGKIVERGSHFELMNKGGKYFEMFAHE